MKKKLEALSFQIQRNADDIYDDLQRIIESYRDAESLGQELEDLQGVFNETCVKLRDKEAQLLQMTWDLEDAEIALEHTEIELQKALEYIENCL